MESTRSKDTLKKAPGNKLVDEVKLTTRFNAAEYERWSFSLRSRGNSRSDGESGRRLHLKDPED
jgi:hypothetical protein